MKEIIDELYKHSFSYEDFYNIIDTLEQIDYENFCHKGVSLFDEDFYEKIKTDIAKQAKKRIEMLDGAQEC